MRTVHREEGLCLVVPTSARIWQGFSSPMSAPREGLGKMKERNRRALVTAEVGFVGSSPAEGFWIGLSGA